MQHKHFCVSLSTSKFKYKPSILIVYYTRNRPMYEHYLIEFVHHRVIILARLDTWPILVIYTRSPFYFGILYYVLSISEFPFFLLAPLFVRYLSLGHPRVSKVWSDENSTKMFFLYLKTYAKNTKIQIKKKNR